MNGQKLRICVVAPEFPPAVGGIENYAYYICLEFARKGHQLSILTRTGNGLYEEEGLFKTHPILSDCRRRDLRKIRPFLSESDIVHVMVANYAYVALEHPRVVVTVHGKDFLSPGPVGGLRLKELLGLPKGDSLSYWIDCFATRRSMVKGLRAASLILPNSRFTQKLVLDTLPELEGRTRVINPGIPDELFDLSLPVKALRAPNGPVRLLTVSRLNESRKSVDQVIRAIAELPHGGFCYDIAGDGELRPGLERLAQDLGVEKQVRFHGRVSNQELYKLYSEANLFLLTSRLEPGNVEGFGIVYLEANVFGIPVLACRNGGTTDAVSEGVNGWFIDSPEVSAIATAVAKFRSGQLWIQPECCINHAKQFRWSQQAVKLESWYAELSG